jgi:hypothetical protein
MFREKSRQEVESQLQGRTNMTKKTAILGAVGATVLAGGLALGATKGAAAPALPAEVQNMGCLVGDWKGTGQIAMGDTKADLKLSISCKWQSGGYSVGCTARFAGPPPVGTLEESDLFGYDADGHKYHWYAITNLGDVHDHVAEIPTGAVIDWVWNGTQQGKPSKETIRMELSQDHKQMSFRTEAFVGGVSTVVFTGALKK